MSEKNVTRREALGLAASFAAATAAGCASGQEAPAGGSSDAEVSLTALQYSLENQESDFNDLWFFDEIEKKTGVHVDFRMVKEADWNTQVSLMFSTPDDMDDLILRWPVDVEDYGVSQGLLLPLDEYLTEEIMPNYVGRLKECDVADSIPASDGKSYFIGYLMAQNVNHNGTWYVSREVLDRLGLDVPQSTDDVTKMLKAMRDDGMEHPFSASFTPTGPESIWNQFASFGVPENTYYVCIGEDDQVLLTVAQKGWRECVEWLHMLYEEGLMDPESLTQDSNLWVNKVNAGEVGYFCYLRLLNSAITPEMTEAFEAILPPAAPGHDACVSRILEVPTAGAYLTSTCKDPEAALRWIDAQLETETMMVALNGKVGEQIQLNDDGKYEVIDVPEDNGLYDFVPVTMGQFFAPGDYYASIYEMAPHRVERFEDSKRYEEAGVLEEKSFQYLRDVAKMASDEAIEANDLHDELQKLVEEAFVTFVRGGVTDELWDAFQQTLKEVGAERYVKLYQKAYDAYLDGSAQGTDA